MAPEIDRKWAEIVRAGTWAEWLNLWDGEPASFSVWTPEDLTPPMVGPQTPVVSQVLLTDDRSAAPG